MSKTIKQFLQGMGQALDMGGTMPTIREPRVARASDAQALRSDWEKIGGDMRRAMQRTKRL